MSILSPGVHRHRRILRTTRLTEENGVRQQEGRGSASALGLLGEGMRSWAHRPRTPETGKPPLRQN